VALLSVNLSFCKSTSLLHNTDRYHHLQPPLHYPPGLRSSSSSPTTTARRNATVFAFFVGPAPKLIVTYTMVYSLTYRRPPHTPSSSSSTSRDSLSGDEKQNSINDSITSGSSSMSNGIPEALSFDRIISGGVCPVRVQSHICMECCQY